MRKYNWHKEVDGQPIRIDWKQAAIVAIITALFLL